MALDGMGVLKGVGISLVGAGVTLAAGYGLSKAASLTQGWREIIVASVGVVALVGATYYGKPVIGVALAAPMFYYSGGSALMRMAAGAPGTAAVDALNAALANAGMTGTSPTSLPASTTAAAHWPVAQYGGAFSVRGG